MVVNRTPDPLATIWGWRTVSDKDGCFALPLAQGGTTRLDKAWISGHTV